MTGQDAVNVAEQFAAAVQFDGVVMTKLDGDARGGAALSVKAVTGKPILFASTGEKLDQFERFHPDRMAQRILGMGDVMSLIEKAEQQFEEDEAKELERKLRRNEFTLEDFLAQLKQIRRMGPLQSILGHDARPRRPAAQELKVDERELDRVEAIILSMTPEERRRPELIKGSRRLRIAKGSGTNVQAVNQLVKQFDQMRKLMRQIGRGKMPDLGALMRRRAVGPGDARARARYPLPSAFPSTSRGLPWQYDSGSPAWAGRRTRSGASSSPTSARRATAASSRPSASTTRRPTLDDHARRGPRPRLAGQGRAADRHRPQAPARSRASTPARR